MEKLVRKRDSYRDKLVVMKDGSVVTKSPTRIQVPTRWMTVNLGEITSITSIYGFFPIIFDDNTYCIFNVCAMINIIPTRTTTVTIEDEPYYEFHFDAGVKMILSLTLVRTDTLTFDILNEFFMKGKVPWWVRVDDLASVFDTAEKHANSKIAKVPQAIEALVSIISRNRNDLSIALRQSAKTLDDYDIDKIEYIPLKSVMYSVNSTVSKLSGSYFHEGVISAIVNPTTTSGKIEKILRA